MIKRSKLHFSRWLLLCLWLAVLACTQVPITGRQSLQLVPNSQLATYAVQQYDDTLKKAKLSTDEAATAMVRKVGMNIARAAEAFLRDSGQTDQVGAFAWEFNLIEEDKTANAWVLPGGKAAVYTGILKYTQNETGLAVVLGHEVAHALANHGNERMSQGLLAQMGGMALAVAVSQKPAATQQVFMGAFGVGTSVGVLLPFSRLHESEADRIGLVLMAMAGYDPREAVEKGGRPPELLSTHPAPDTRIEDIQRHLPEAMPYYEKARKKQ
jgi:predicted Zn-dependent protease